MKTIPLSLLLLLFLSADSAFSAAGPFYQVVCKTAPSIILTQVNNRAVVGTNIQFQSVFYIRYKKAAGKGNADASGVQPGECAWVDRPIAANEPDCATFSPENSKSSPALYVPASWGIHSDGKYDVSQANVMEITEVVAYKKLNKSSGQRFQFKARNTGTNCMEIQGEGQYKTFPKWVF